MGMCLCRVFPITLWVLEEPTRRDHGSDQRLRAGCSVNVLELTYGTLADRRSGYTVRSARIKEALERAGHAVTSFSVIPEANTQDHLEALPERLLPAARSLLQSLSEPIDLVHAHSQWWVAGVAKRIAREFEIPWIYEVRGLPEDSMAGKVYLEGSIAHETRRRREIEVCNDAAGVLSISQLLLDDLRSRGMQNENAAIAPNCASHNPPRSKARIGYAGAYRPLEGTAWLLRSLAEAFGSTGLVEVHLAGSQDGETAREIKGARARGLIVREYGEIKPSDMERFYRSIDLVIIPRPRTRVTEIVTPLKPIEALGWGVPVLCSDLPALREVCEDRAWFFEPGDSASLASAVLRVFPWLRPVRTWDTYTRAFLGVATRAIEEHLRAKAC